MMTIDEFVNQITKPLYIYRMASANKDSSNPAMRKSAQTRMLNAKKEIQRIAEIYGMYCDDADD